MINKPHFLLHLWVFLDYLRSIPLFVSSMNDTHRIVIGKSFDFSFSIHTLTSYIMHLINPTIRTCHTWSPLKYWTTIIFSWKFTTLADLLYQNWFSNFNIWVTYISNLTVECQLWLYIANITICIQYGVSYFSSSINNIIKSYYSR